MIEETNSFLKNNLRQTLQKIPYVFKKRQITFLTLLFLLLLLPVNFLGQIQNIQHKEGTTTITHSLSEQIIPLAYATSGFISGSGQKLMLNGSQFQFIGFNAPGMYGGCWNGTNFTTAQMDTYFSNLPSNGMTRIFAVKPVGTSLISTIVNEATKYNQHLILVLGDDDSYCNDTDGSPNGQGSGKTAVYYQSGWRGQYLTWINTIVPMFKNSTTVAMWEIANEPFHVGATGSQLGLSTMQSYLNSAASAIKVDDPNHLIESGLSDSADAGGISNYNTVQSDSNINVISFHDYAWDYENKATISANFTTAQSTAQSLNKPFIAGEAGVKAGTGCTTNTGLSLTNRVNYLITKTNAYMKGSTSGVDFWDYEQTGSSCSYEILSGDPLISAVKNYTLPK